MNVEDFENLVAQYLRDLERVEVTVKDFMDYLRRNIVSAGHGGDVNAKVFEAWFRMYIMLGTSRKATKSRINNVMEVISTWLK